MDRWMCGDLMSGYFVYDCLIAWALGFGVWDVLTGAAVQCSRCALDGLVSVAVGWRWVEVGGRGWVIVANHTELHYTGKTCIFHNK